MELSIEELVKLKEAVIGNIAITINGMHENLSRYVDDIETDELLRSVKELSDNATLLRKISNTIELNKISEKVESDNE